MCSKTRARPCKLERSDQLYNSKVERMGQGWWMEQNTESHNELE